MHKFWKLTALNLLVKPQPTIFHSQQIRSNFALASLKVNQLHTTGKASLKSMNRDLKPFIKWAGGKTQFLEIINLLLPHNYNQFVEPFVGGGSVFLNAQPKQLIINDLNQELMITYRIIKETN